LNPLELLQVLASTLGIACRAVDREQPKMRGSQQRIEFRCPLVKGARFVSPPHFLVERAELIVSDGLFGCAFDKTFKLLRSLFELASILVEQPEVEPSVRQ